MITDSMRERNSPIGTIPRGRGTGAQCYYRAERDQINQIEKRIRTGGW
jgi:hypothetical protein